MLSMKTRYAIKALLSLANEPTREPVLIAELAEKENIPKKFLELILLDLKAMGILGSRKGKGGGYFLRLEPRQVTIGSIVRGIEGPLALLQCVSQTRYQRCADCPDEKLCGMRMVFRDVREATSKILDNTSLADVLTRVDQAAVNPELMFHI
ncbi:MAG: Rrf2 family transcriptional regulator [Planctomycetota bacterium]